jgi:hypothetical protein
MQRCWKSAIGYRRLPRASPSVVAGSRRIARRSGRMAALTTLPARRMRPPQLGAMDPRGPTT